MGRWLYFYRLQSQSKIFEDVFLREGIPFEVSLKKTVGDVPVLKWCIRSSPVFTEHKGYGIRDLCTFQPGVRGRYQREKG